MVATNLGVSSVTMQALSEEGEELEEGLVVGDVPHGSIRLPTSPRQRNRSSDKVRLLSLNLNLLPFGSRLVHGFGHSYKTDRLDEFARVLSLQAYDILALQEVFSTPHLPSFLCYQEKLISVAKLYGYKYVVRSQQPNMWDLMVRHKWTDAGLLILSRYPIVAHDAREFAAEGAHVDKWACKGVLYAKVKIRDTSIMLFNCHLQASHLSFSAPTAPRIPLPLASLFRSAPSSQRGGNWSLPRDIYADARQRQLMEVKQYINEKQHEQGMVPCDWVLTGDFNVDAIGM